MLGLGFLDFFWFFLLCMFLEFFSMWYIIMEFFFMISFVMLGVISFIFDFLLIFVFFGLVVFCLGNGSLVCKNFIASWFVVEFYGMFCEIMVMYFIIFLMKVVFVGLSCSFECVTFM